VLRVSEYLGLLGAALTSAYRTSSTEAKCAVDSYPRYWNVGT
jgi:hypothetical protein